MTRLLVLKEDDLECIWRHHSQTKTHCGYEIYNASEQQERYLVCSSYDREIVLQTRKPPIVKWLFNYHLSPNADTYRIHEYPLNLL